MPATLHACQCPPPLHLLPHLLPVPCTAPAQVGVLKARQLAAQHRLPLIPVHHMEAHALVARLGATAFAAEAAAVEVAAAGSGAASSGSGGGVEFPFLCLLISGGHNLLLLVEGVGQYSQLGTTLDDALGALCCAVVAHCVPACTQLDSGRGARPRPCHHRAPTALTLLPTHAARQERRTTKWRACWAFT